MYLSQILRPKGQTLPVGGYIAERLCSLAKVHRAPGIPDVSEGIQHAVGNKMEEKGLQFSEGADILREGQEDIQISVAWERTCYIKKEQRKERW